jgi:hypothetical protein
MAEVPDQYPKFQEKIVHLFDDKGLEEFIDVIN